MRGIAALSAIVLAGGFGPALRAEQAFAPPLPPLAKLVAEREEEFGALRLPVGPWAAGEVPTIRAEGAIVRRVWQVAQPGLTPAQLVAPIREALEAAGFTILYECGAQSCGGFEFRFATDTLPPPDMFVDLGRYRFLAAQAEGEETPRWRSVMASATADRAFVQITTIEPSRVAPVAAPAVVPDRPEAGLGSQLETRGHAALWDVAFDSGATALGPGPFAALDALAVWLAETPSARIALVGHTDAEGALETNIALSRRRAQAVRDRLVAAYGIDPDRLDAEGVGYLAPIASNATRDGRERNRRVEAVLISRGE